MRERLLKDWPLKLVALLIAFGVWLSITGQDRMLSDFTVPLEVEYGPERIAGGPQPTAVTVRLEGPRTAMRRLDPLRMAVRLDLKEAPYGEREVPLSRSQLTGVPRSIDVSRFDPDRVTLQVARRARRELEIVPDLVGELPTGYALYGYEVRPETITVEGTPAAVDGLGSLATESIRLDGQTASFVASVGVIPEDPRVHVLETDPLEVEVLIDRPPVEARIEGIEVRVPGIPANRVSVHPRTVRATLSGPPWLMERLQRTQISAAAIVGPGAADVVSRAPVEIELRLDEEERRLVKVRAIRPSHVTVRTSE
jgi:YbbR domain-containing protein